MRTRREKSRRNVRKQSRRIQFEALGSRIALSAGGFGGALLDGSLRVDVDHGDHSNRAAEFASQGFAIAGQYSTLQFPSVNLTQARLEQVGPSRFFNLPHDRGIPQRQLESRGAAVPQIGTNAWIIGGNVSLPGLVLSPGTVLTIVITSSPNNDTLGTPLGEPQVGRSEPSQADRPWVSNLLSPLAVANRLADSSEARPSGTTQAGGEVRANVAHANGASRGDNPPVALVSNVVPPANAEPRLGRVGTTTGGEPEGDKVPKIVPQLPLGAGQWSITSAELQSGLIELESPLAPRLQGKPLADDELDGEANSPGDLEDLQRLIKGFWTAWSAAWAAFGEGAPSAADQEATQNLVRTQHAGEFDVGVIEGLVELVVDESGTTVDQPGRSQWSGESNTVVRMDAGVAVYQEFEVATAPNAVPQTTTAPRSKRADAEHESAKSEDRTTEEQPHAAAMTGLGVLVSLPFSGCKRGKEDREVHPRQVRLRRNA